MKDKRGFTLVELIAVIAIIGIIAVLAFVSMNSIIKSVKNNQQERQINSIEAAAKLYAQHEKAPNGKTISSTLSVTVVTITVYDLLTSGYLTPTIENGINNCTYSKGCLLDPVTNEILNEIEITLYKNEAGKIVAVYNEGTSNN